MLKRIAVIGLLTGVGQLFSVFSLKFISAQVTPYDLAAIGRADSFVQFLLNIIAFGLQPAAMRSIVLSENWRTEYAAAQSARFTLGLLLLIFSLTAFREPVYVLFALAPLLALSGDYALYATGNSVAGALIALTRILLPYGLLIIASIINQQWLFIFFTAGIAVSFLLTNMVIAYKLNTPILFKPGFKSLELYIRSIPLGIVSVSLYFIGLGLVLVVPYFYDTKSTAVIFVGLKFYMIFKGVLRIIHQAFLKEMVSENVCLKIDQLSIILGMSFFWSVLLFPKSFIEIFFGIQYSNYSIFFQWLSISALLYSFFLSAATKSMLLRKDKAYTIATAFAAFITIAAFAAFSFFWKSPAYAGISIFLGELTWIIGLILITAEKKPVLKRLLFTIQNIPVALILLFFLYLFGDTISVYVTAIFIFSAFQLILYYNKLKNLTSV